MLVTKDNNHVQEALDRLLQQYKGLPLMTGLITAFVQQIQALENAAYPINEGRQLWNGTTYPAIGAQLDGIGSLVGISRNGLDDAEYLVFILGTIAENFSDTTLPTITNIINIFFEPQQMVVSENWPAELGVGIAGSSLDPSLYLTVAKIIQASMGAGIKLGYIATFPNTKAFKYSNALGGPSFVGAAGYDNATSPGAGGAYAGVIYNNAGETGNVY